MSVAIYLIVLLIQVFYALYIFWRSAIPIKLNYNLGCKLPESIIWGLSADIFSKIYGFL